VIHTDFEDFVTPILDKLDGNLSPGTQRKAMRKGAVWLTTAIKYNIGASKGLENQKRYKRLKIKYRYHGRKELSPTRANIKFAERNPRSADVIPGGGVLKVSRTVVTGATKPLVDRGNFKRSWGILRARADRVDVGPRDGHNGALAIYHGPGKPDAVRKQKNRTDTRWGRRTADQFVKVFMRMVDAGVFDR